MLIDKMKPELKQFIEYVKPFLDKATEGKYSGHNFNSYFPSHLKGDIPIYFRDLVQTSLAQISKRSKDSPMSKWYFDFLNDENLKELPGGCEPYYMPWMLYESIKCLELYLDKIGV